MATPAWPESILNRPEQGDYQEDQEPNTVLAEVDIGPAHQRPRFTTSSTVIKGRFILDGDQADTIQAFYLDDLDGGSKVFEWEHPRKEQTYLVQFNGEQGLRIRPLGAAFLVELEFDLIGVTDPLRLTIEAGVGTAASAIPGIVTDANMSPPSANSTGAGAAPSVLTDILAVAVAGVATGAGDAPTVFAESGIELTAAAGVASAAANAPSVTVNSKVDIAAAPGVATAAADGPSVVADVVLSAAPGASTAAADAPTVSATEVLPTVESSTSSDDTGTSHTVALPTGVVDGSFVLFFFAEENFRTLTWPSWITEIRAVDDGSGNPRGHHIAYGTAPSALSSISVSSSGNCDSIHHAYRISSAGGVTASAAATANSSTIDPPSFSPAAGSDYYLWFASAVQKADSITNDPSGYTAGQVNTRNSVVMRTAYRLLEASTEDPGTMSGTNNSWTAITSAVAPG